MLNVSHIVNTVFTSRSYILSIDGGRTVWLVDCGDVDVIIRQLSSQFDSGFVVRGVLLTHAHYDHIYGLPRLKALFPDVKVYTNAYGRRMLTDARMNMSKYHADSICFGGDNVIVCEEGDVIDLFDGIQARVYDTPGHNPSCLTYEVGEYLFTGDAFIPGVKVVTTLPGADKHLAVESLERIAILAEGRVVCPGHEIMD